MSGQLLIGAILAIIALMVVLSAVTMMVLLKERKPRNPVKKEPGLSFAEGFAKQILAGTVSADLLEHYVPGGRKCQNCGGKQKKPRWTPASAEEHLQLPRLAEAIRNTELCASCILVLAKRAGNGKVVVVDKPAAADKPAPAVAAKAAGRPARELWLAIWGFISRIPVLFWKAVKWVLSKVLLIWEILFLLGIDVFAIRMMFWVAEAAGKHPPGIFITFLEYGVAGFALVIIVVTLFSLFPLLKRLVK